MTISPIPKWNIFVAGAAAGLIVDTSLYPIDTIKSRLQSESGFIKSGGFKSLYRGLLPVLAGSIPSSSFFFLTYESIKEQLINIDKYSSHSYHWNHILAASVGEVVACTARVPTEVVKLRSQTSSGKTSIEIARNIITNEGFRGLYRGFLSTAIRDTPFSAIQFPIWEFLKKNHQKHSDEKPGIYQSSFYGSIAGAVAALVTCPLDVAKTRIMLGGEDKLLASGRIRDALRLIWLESGPLGWFAGVTPRIIWISVGAAIWLGSYEKFLHIRSENQLT